MIDISRKTYDKNDTEILVENDEILWLNEKHIVQRFYHKRLEEITI